MNVLLVAISSTVKSSTARRTACSTAAHRASTQDMHQVVDCLGTAVVCPCMLCTPGPVAMMSDRHGNGARQCSAEGLDAYTQKPHGAAVPSCVEQAPARLQ